MRRLVLSITDLPVTDFYFCPPHDWDNYRQKAQGGLWTSPIKTTTWKNDWHSWCHSEDFAHERIFNVIKIKFDVEDIINTREWDFTYKSLDRYRLVYHDGWRYDPKLGSHEYDFSSWDVETFYIMDWNIIEFIRSYNEFEFMIRYPWYINDHIGQRQASELTRCRLKKSSN